LLAGEQWFRAYENGIKALKIKNYGLAIMKFREAIKAQPQDKKKIRTYGMHFIEYYPHRELGIALYYTGKLDEAKRHLQMSLQQTPSQRASLYLGKIVKGDKPVTRVRKKNTKPVRNNKPPATSTSPTTAAKKLIIGKKTIKLVGERMGIAVLPFENKGASRDLGEIVFDKMITALFNLSRFKVIERDQLERILQEQQLGMTGVIDASTAAEIGKGIGVDAILMGSVAAAQSGAISLDAFIL